MVQLVSALPLGRDEAHRFEHREVLRDGLAREVEPMLHRETNAQLVQCLTVPVAELVQDGAACWRSECVEDSDHAGTIGKSTLACQVGARHRRPARSERGAHAGMEAPATSSLKTPYAGFGT